LIESRHLEPPGPKDVAVGRVRLLLALREVVQLDDEPLVRGAHLGPML
jgi:hypothetical protein